MRILAEAHSPSLGVSGSQRCSELLIECTQPQLSAGFQLVHRSSQTHGCGGRAASSGHVCGEEPGMLSKASPAWGHHRHRPPSPSSSSCSFISLEKKLQGRGQIITELVAEPCWPQWDAGGGTGREREKGGGDRVGECLLEGIKGSILSGEKEMRIKSASSACWTLGEDLWPGSGRQRSWRWDPAQPRGTLQ